jgi:uncharacterized protein involved in response to NO
VRPASPERLRGPASQAGAPVAKPEGFALWRLGFRPFYLLASIFAAVSILLWIGEYGGFLPRTYGGDPVWHAHEMLFGYTLAVLTGFLFTAGRNWTGQPTPTGALLAGYALLWIAGRIVVLTPYAVLAALLNAAFPIAVAAGLAVPLMRSGNRRNLFFVVLLALLGLATAAIHTARLGLATWPERASLQAGLDVVLLVIAVMAGRVVPMFTNNGVPGGRAARDPRIEKAALGSVIVLTAADVLRLDAPWIATVAAFATIAHAARFALWRPWRTRRAPLVWVLHAAYAWVVIHLGLRALAALGLVAVPLATHALTIGAIGAMTLGMMVRTARGHTGRALRADRFEIACFVLVLFAAIVRVFGALLLPGLYRATVLASGLCWSGAFALYAIRYWPVLTRPRIDGKPG